MQRTGLSGVAKIVVLKAVLNTRFASSANRPAANANRWLDACIARKVYEMSDFVISYKDNGQSCKVIWSGLNAQNAIDTFWASFDERDRSKISYVRLFGLVEIFNASQQNFAPDVAICEDCGKSPAMEGCSVCAECGL